MVVQMDLFNGSAPVPASAGSGAADKCAADKCAAESSVVSNDFCGVMFADMCHRAGLESMMDMFDPCYSCCYHGLCDHDECAAHCYKLDVNDPCEDEESFYII